MLEFKTYLKPFDVNKPPPVPPNREFVRSPFIGWVQTRASKQETAEYRYRLDEYEQYFM